MPLGNLTSQFFANVYLNELDHFVKHKLKAKYYLRYVDDFVILESDKEILEFYKCQIDEFLKSNLNLELHKDKLKILKLGNCITFLGFRVFYYHNLLKKSNLRKMNSHICLLQDGYRNGLIEYDEAYDFIEGWIVYAKNGSTYKLRKRVLANFESGFPNEISTKEINRYLKIQKKEDYASCTNAGKRHGIHPTDMSEKQSFSEHTQKSSISDEFAGILPTFL